jgi:SAM-dependent methyltransferase
MRRLAHRWRDRFPPKGIRLPRDRVRQIVEAHGAQSWFLYAFEERHTRWDLWESGFWVLRHLPRWSRILETGCGCGLNLIWLGQQRFTNLHGFDLDPKAIAAGEELCREAGVPGRLWCDDGLDPLGLGEEPFDLVMHLAPGGFLLFDAIDRSYDLVSNNQYLTSDWNKPEEQRRPSEYRSRFSEGDVRDAIERAGMTLIHRIHRPGAAPRVIYVAG